MPDDEKLVSSMHSLPASKPFAHAFGHRKVALSYFNTPKPLPALIVFQDSPRDTALSTKETIRLSG